MMRERFNNKKYTPKELRSRYGAFTISNETNENLIKGAENQWKRYNDPAFIEEEFNSKINVYNGWI